jgi:hypothetical protein
MYIKEREQKMHQEIGNIMRGKDPFIACLESRKTRKTMCPFIMNMPELCRAALSSSMIDKNGCIDDSHDRCPLFLINKSGRDTDLNESSIQMI